MLDIFNATYYLARNPDVHAAVQSGALTAREHFDRWGKYEGRDPSPLFNTREYLAMYPDVAAAVEEGLITAYDHFVHYGIAEGRKPFAAFEPEYYLACNPDVAEAVAAGGTNAVQHFVLHGSAENRDFLPGHDVAAFVSGRPVLGELLSDGGVSVVEYMIQEVILGLEIITIAPTVPQWRETGVAPETPPAPSDTLPAEPGEPITPILPVEPVQPAEPIMPVNPINPSDPMITEYLDMIASIDWFAIAYDPVLINAYMLEDLNQFYQRLLEYIPEQYKHYMVNPADVAVTWDMLESFAMELFAPYLDMYASAGIYASATPRGIAAYDVADDEWGALFFKSNGGTDAQAGAAHQGDASVWGASDAGLQVIGNPSDAVSVNEFFA